MTADRVDELVRRRAQLSPEAAAISWDGGTVRYDELVREAELIAGQLTALGGVQGQAVAIRLPPGPRRITTSLGVLRAGGHLVWFGTGDAGERGRAILAELRPAFLLCQAEQDDDLARWFRDELGGRVVDLLGVTPAPIVDTVSSEQMAYVAYTSGSTGRPKGVAQSHEALVQFVTWMAGALDIGPGARVAQWAAPEHDPSLCEVFATLTAGGTLCPVPDRIRAHPEKLAEWLEAERITFLQTVPSFARELVEVITDSSLQRLVLMGETLPGKLVNALRTALPSVRLANVYGPTETIAATWHEITGEQAAVVPIGRPIPGRKVLVLDGTGRPCPTGVVGEIVIHSPYVAPENVDDRTFGRVRCHRTGDLGAVREDGLLEFRGREDLQVKLNGRRIELSGVEAALAEHESVTECAIVPVTDEDGLVTRLVAYVVPRGNSTVGVWRAHLRHRYGTALALMSFTTLADRLPRNLSGKVDRSRLCTATTRGRSES